MHTSELTQFVEAQINLAAGKLISQDRYTSDALSYGKLSFFMALRRVLQGQAVPEDLGVLDAVNDTLQKLELLAKGKTFLSAVDMSVISVSDRNFDAEVLKSTLPVVVEFSKPGQNEFGEPDQSARTGAIINDLAGEFQGRLKFVRLAWAQNPEIAQRYLVKTVPSLGFFHHGALKGLEPDFHLKVWIRSKLNDWLDDPSKQRT
jgi:hypothetical protein